MPKPAIRVRLGPELCPEYLNILKGWMFTSKYLVFASETCAPTAILWYEFLEWLRRISVPLTQTILWEESKWNIH